MALMDFLGKEALSACLAPQMISTAKLLAFMGILSLSMIPILVFLNLYVISDKSKACYGAIISCIIPSYHLFADMPDIFFVCPGLLIILLVLLTLKTNQLRYLFLAGFLISTALFFSFSFAPIGFFALLLVVLHVKNKGKKVAGQFGLVFCISLLIPLILPMAINYNALEMLIVINKNNQQFYSMSSRSMISAFGMNIFELFLFTGAIWPVLYFRSVPPFFWDNARKIFSMREISLETKFLMASMSTVAVLLISGGVRGEIARNGMIIMPLISMPLPLYYKFKGNAFLILTAFAFLAFAIVCSLMEVSFDFLFDYLVCI